MNDAWIKTTGYEPHEVIGHTAQEMNIWTIMEERDQMLDYIQKTGGVHDYEAKYRMKSGEIRYFLVSAEIIDMNNRTHILCVHKDITEHKQMEVEMTRLDRLNLVGEMAASIGHEIRNPMTTVRGYLQLLRENKYYHQEIEFFDLMIEELDRANSIITEFLSLAKNKMVELKLTSLNIIISKLLPLVQAKAMSRDQHIYVELGDLPDILLDNKEIRQLILNLVNNGMDSISSAGGVTIRTFVENGKVVLAIQDQGHGIDRELLNKLGTPFFTTKEQGTGLGLAICYRIATRHKAQIDIETSSTGTTFFIRFPSPIVTAKQGFCR
jgi:PAS domain S-box-containing protein